MAEWIEVFILAYNRPDTIIESIDSVLSQDYPTLRIIVSDNSTNNTVKQSLDERYTGEKPFEYRRRIPSLEVVEHFNTALEEVTSEYFLLFHDDDVMFPNMVSTLMNKFILKQHTGAIGCNAYVLKGQYKSSCKFYKGKLIIMPINCEDFIMPYLSFSGVIPFPSYLYRKSRIEGVNFENIAGKYSDVVFLLNICMRSGIQYVGKPLMYYRVHPKQDSAHDDFNSRKKLISFIIKNTSYSKNDLAIKRFRLFNIYREIKTVIQYEKVYVSNKSILKLLNFALHYSNFYLFARLVYLYFLNRKNQISEN